MASDTRFDIEIDTSEVESALRRLSLVDTRFHRVLKLAAEELVTAVKSEFDTGGHGQWPPHAANTARVKIDKAVQRLQKTSAGRALASRVFSDAVSSFSHRGFGSLSANFTRGALGQLLVDTGRLRGSITGATGDDYAEASTDVSYAVYHISKKPRRIIPLRNFFDIDPKALEQIENNLVRRIKDLIDV